MLEAQILRRDHETASQRVSQKPRAKNDQSVLAGGSPSPSVEKSSAYEEM